MLILWRPGLRMRYPNPKPQVWVGLGALRKYRHICISCICFLCVHRIRLNTDIYIYIYIHRCRATSTRSCLQMSQANPCSVLPPGRHLSLQGSRLRSQHPDLESNAGLWAFFRVSEFGGSWFQELEGVGFGGGQSS